MNVHRRLAAAALALAVAVAAGAVAVAGPAFAQAKKDQQVAAKQATPAAANRFNRLFKGASNFNLPPAEDGIHDPENPGTLALQPPKVAFESLPSSKGGNRVDWVAALHQGAIDPRADRLNPDKNMTTMDLNIVRQVKGSMPDVVYPHKQHTEWLDCTNCHPKIFIPKKGANKISMAAILMGQYCGVCHGKVAFPVSECRLCHSKDKSPEEIKKRQTAGGGAKAAKAAPAPAAAPAPPAVKTAKVETASLPAASVPAGGGGSGGLEAVTKAGAQVYADNCAGCHGETGEGIPDTFPALAGSKVATGPVNGHIAVVLDGVPETAMQAWRDMLSPEEIAAVITYERNAFGNGSGDLVTAAQVQSVATGRAAGAVDPTEALISRGAQVYAENCSGCHGEKGEGIPDTFPPLNGSKVVAGPAAAHVDVVVNGRADTAMQGWKEMLSAEDIAAVITFERNAWDNKTGDVVTAQAVSQAIAQ